MIGPSHRAVTELAFELLKEMDVFLPINDKKHIIAQESDDTDYYKDVEFIDVEGGVGSGGRDNPHKDETWAIDDVPHYKYEDMYFTCFNHFIDIKKGTGHFDDYDGYSYVYGSASKNQNQDVGDAISDWRVKALSAIAEFYGGLKVDQGINLWFNDEYVHAPGRRWYRGCSPAIERYSYFFDKEIYNSIQDEARARFPVANSSGAEGKGIPYSVFMPVDNLARYWFNRYQSEPNPVFLGPVLHAVQDAAVLHHAAGTCGNWHGKYETKLNTRLAVWKTSSRFKKDIKALFSTWCKKDDSPPQYLGTTDYNKTPSMYWKIDMLVTWLALNSYKDYLTVYNNFDNGYIYSEKNMKELTRKAVSMSMLVLCKASKYKPPGVVTRARITDESYLWLLFT